MNGHVIDRFADNRSLSRRIQENIATRRGDVAYLIEDLGFLSIRSTLESEGSW